MNGQQAPRSLRGFGDFCDVFAAFCYSISSLLFSPNFLQFVIPWKSMSVEKSLIFYEKYPWNIFVVRKFALPLHSLSGTNATAQFLVKQMILENIPYRQAVQHRWLIFFWLSVKCKVRNEKRTVNFKLIYEISGQYKQFEKLCLFLALTDIIYNEEFDPGSGWTLATGLTHASRGVSGELASLGRPAHGWVTRIQPALHIGIASRKGD